MPFKNYKMTGKNRKSWKKDAEYWKRRYEELKASNLTLSEKTAKTPSVEDKNVNTLNAKNSVDNTAKTPQKIPEASNSVLTNSKDGEVVTKQQEESKQTLASPPQEFNAVDNSNKAKKVAENVPDSEKQLTPEEADEKYKFKCGECGSYFNELKEGCCPNCEVTLQ